MKMSTEKEMVRDYNIEKSEELDLLVGLRPQHPPISKNKNKPKIPDNPNVLFPCMLEIRTGADVAKSIFDYVHHKGRGICIISGIGVVEQVTLRYPTGEIATHQGKLQIVSISGTIFPSPTPTNVDGLTINLFDTKGHMFGGNVIPPLVASSPVVLTTASFANPVIEKLSSVAYDQGEDESNYLDADGHVAEGDGDLLSVGGSTTEMRNMVSKRIKTNHPSSST